jgi:hypothetical protein
MTFAPNYPHRVIRKLDDGTNLETNVGKNQYLEDARTFNLLGRTFLTLAFGHLGSTGLLLAGAQIFGSSSIVLNNDELIDACRTEAMIM